MRLEGQRDKKKKQRQTAASSTLSSSPQLCHSFVPALSSSSGTDKLEKKERFVHVANVRGREGKKRQTPPKGKGMDELINFFSKKNISNRQVPGLDKSD